jgi:hypothetical protein
MYKEILSGAAIVVTFVLFVRYIRNIPNTDYQRRGLPFPSAWRTRFRPGIIPSIRPGSGARRHEANPRPVGRHGDRMPRAIRVSAN